MKKTIKTLKHRFWTEVHDGAKLFYLKGMKFGRYMKIDVRNLSRYMSLQKFRPLVWRNSHSYVLVDRLLDVTPPDQVAKNKKTDRNVCLYGYVRGPNLKPGAKVHIPGVGDFFMKDISVLDDPCPRPQKKAKQQLRGEDKVIYAPMADLGIVSYDKDATFIEFNRKPIYKKIGEGEDAVDVEEGGDGEAMVRALHGVGDTMEDGLDNTSFQLFSGSRSITQDEFQAANIASKRNGHADSDDGSDDSDNDSDDDEEDDEMDIDDSDDEDGENGRKNGAADSDDDMDDDAYYQDDDEDDEDGEGESARMSVDSKSAATRRNRRAAVFTPDGPKAASDVKPKGKKSQKSGDSDDDEDGELQFDDSLSEVDEAEAASASGSDEDSGSSDEDGSDHSDEESVDADEAPERRRKIRSGKSAATDLDEEEERIERILSANLAEKRRLADMDVDEEESGEEEDEDDSGLRWKENLAQRALDRFTTPLNLMKIVYGEAKDESRSGSSEDKRRNYLDDDQEAPLFRLRTAKSLSVDGDVNEIESCRDAMFDREEVALDFKNNRDIAAILASRFISKGSFLKDGDGVLESDDDEAAIAKEAAKKDVLNDAPMFGDFEDLETGERAVADGSDADESSSQADGASESGDDEEKAKEIARRKAEKKQAFEAAYDSIKRSGGSMDELHVAIDKMREDMSDSEDENEIPEINPGEKKKGASSASKKETQALEHDWMTSTKAAMDKQQKMNLDAFKNMDEESRKRLEGLRAGLYVRVEIENVPCELIENFDARYPILIGALLPNEHSFGMVQVRIKRHRWAPKILKTHDPLIFSVGWRRFQTMPVYSIESHGRNRMLKYTPEHMHCLATFYGPVTPPNTGFIAFQRMSNDQAGFRVSANGGTSIANFAHIDLVQARRIHNSTI